VLTIDIGCDMIYSVRHQTVFLFQITGATTAHQRVLSQDLSISPYLEMDSFQSGTEGNLLHRVVVDPCEMRVQYRARMEMAPVVVSAIEVGETPMAEMPPEVLIYLNPSRYCESDLLSRFAYEEFGNLYRGYSRVQAICNWVFEQLDYTPGSTTNTTTAADVLLQRTGLCRDYAHLAITLCRGVGIPARYVAGYAVNLQPPDFHGFMEAFLDGQWYLFDPTRLSLVSGLVRIGVGRDAADVSFATINGDARLEIKSVWANLVQGTSQVTLEHIGDAGISTA